MKSLKQRYVISSDTYDTKEQALEQMKKWDANDDLDHKARVWEVVGEPYKLVRTYEIQNDETTLSQVNEKDRGENPYASEKVTPNSSWAYDPNSLPSLKEQRKNLRNFLGLKETSIEVIPWEGETPTEADGLMLIPSLSDLGRCFKIDDPLGDGYGPLTEKVLERLGKVRQPFNNHRDGLLTDTHIRLNASIRTQWERLERQNRIVPEVFRLFEMPVSTGKMYQGYSPRNARQDALLKGMLPLGPIEVACVLALWPKRLKKYSETWIDASAAEYVLSADGGFGRSLFLYWFEGELEFGYCWAGGPDEFYGAAMAFLPE